MTWASRAVSPPSASLEGKVWRQIGQISLSCKRVRGEMKGLEEGDDDDDGWSENRLDPASGSIIDLTRGLLLDEDDNLVIASMEEYRE
jgi:hypothetical protein